MFRWSSTGRLCPVIAHIADVPLDGCRAEVIALVRRRDGVEDPLVPRIDEGCRATEEIAAWTSLQEQWFDTLVEVGDPIATRGMTRGGVGPQMFGGLFQADADSAMESLGRLAGLRTRLLLPQHTNPWRGPIAEATDHIRSRV